MLAVDPGVHACGFAYSGAGDRLVHAGLHPTTLGPLIVDGWDTRAVVEIPQVYKGAPVRTKDLIDLAAAAGRVSAAHVVTYRRPAQWKGQLPKEIQHGRMWKVLDSGECELLRQCLDAVAPSLQHNVLDAVCLLMRTLRRL